MARFISCSRVCSIASAWFAVSAAVAGVALLFGLGAPPASAADAPTAPPAPERRYVGTSESPAGRNANTRVWQNLYQVPEISLITQQPTGRMLDQKEGYFEKGTNICYDARDLCVLCDLCGSTTVPTSPQWEVTDIRIEPSALSGYAYQVVKGPVRAYFKAGARGTEPNVRLDVRTGAVVGTQLLGLLYYDPATKRTAAVDAPRDVAPEASANRLLYRGAFACGSLEYVYTHTGVEQDLIIENPSALPDPASLGFDPATCVLMVGTCVSALSALSAAPGPALPLPAARVLDTKSSAILSADIRSAPLSDPAARRKEGTALALEFAPASSLTARACAFDAGLAYDASSPRALRPGDGVSTASRPSESAPSPETDLYKVVERVNAAGDVNLLEGVPLAWLRAPARAFPVRIDYSYVVKGGAGAVCETWVKGVTYHVTSTFLVANGYSLAIEPGAIVKVADGLDAGVWVGPTGKLICQGNPYDYIHFVPDDTNIGAAVASPPEARPPATYGSLAPHRCPRSSTPVSRRDTTGLSCRVQPPRSARRRTAPIS